MGSIAQYAIDYIYAKITGGKVIFGNKAAYKTHYELTDFATDDLITRYAMESYVPSAYVPTQFLMASGRSLPYTVGTDLTNALIVTTYLCLSDGVRKISSQEFDVNLTSGQSSTDDVFTIESITLYGHDDGSGINLDDLWVVISKA